MAGLSLANLAIWFDPPVAILASLTAGLLIGGFVDRVIVRLPAAMKRAWETDDEDGSLRAGPDTRPCSISASTLAGDMQADAAWVERRASRSRRRLFVRLVCGVAFALLAARFELGVGLFAALAATAVLIALAFIDWDHHLLPDILVLPLLGSGLLVNLTGLFVPSGEALLGAIGGYGSLWLLACAYRLVFGRRGIGEGDLKLMAALGAWLGWRALLPLTQLAAGLALAATLAAMLGRPRDRVPRQLPYGTYMAVAGWLLLVRHPL